MGIFMFHRPEPRKFNYIPRYYDPEKEALERKKAEMGVSSSLSEEDKLRIKMRKSWGRGSEEGKEKSGRGISYKTLRSIIFICFAALLVYFILFTPLIDDFIKMFLMLGNQK
ncbi:MAG: hypothetical protein ACI358_06205 [Candidatus Limimorpha sp.]